MAGQSTMEGIAKLMAAKAMIGGAAGKVKDFASGDARAEKRMKKRNAKAKKEQSEKILKEEAEIHAQWLRDNGSLLQAIKDRAFNSRRILTEEQEIAKEAIDAAEEEKAESKMASKQKRNEIISGGIQEKIKGKAAREEAKIKATALAETEKLSKEETLARRTAIAKGLDGAKGFEGLDQAAIVEKIKAQELAKEKNDLEEEQI
jgi:hypothetical protein